MPKKHPLHNEYDPAVLVPLLRDTAASLRLFAATRLRETGWTPPDTEHEVLYRIALADWDAVVYLGEAAVGALIGRLDDLDWDVRMRAAWALGELFAAEAAPALRARLGDTVADVRREAAWALGRLGDKEALAGLRAALHDADAEVQIAAAGALAHLPAPDAVTDLITLREATTDEGEAFDRLRAAAEAALQKIGGAAARAALDRWQAAAEPLAPDEEAAEDEDEDSHPVL